MRLFLLSSLLALFVSTAFSQSTVNVPAMKDNTLYESATGALSNGIGQHFFCGRLNTTGGGLIRRGVIAFDVASMVPSGSTIISATLTLNLSQTSSGSQNCAIHRATANWGEGTSNAPGTESGGTASTTNDATWIHTFFNTQLWTAAGGDFAAGPSAITAVNAIGSYTWSSATVTTDVQDMLDNPGNNFGWVLIGNESTIHTAKRFDTREHPTGSVRPDLEITYCPPAEIVINEVDYDQPSIDTSEFIELFNAGSCAENLDPYTVELVNGTGGGATIYQTINLPNVMLQPGDYYVICANQNATVNCDLDVSPNSNLIQNGAPDAVGLRNGGTLVDAVSYEGNTGAPYTEGSGVGLLDSFSVPFFGISRVPNGEDTDQNDNDFQGSCVTPGFENVVEDFGCSVSADAGPDVEVCAGEQGLIGGSPTAMNGTGAYTYAWVPSTGLSATNVPNPLASPTSTTMYIVTVTDQAGSTDMDTMVFTVNAIPNVTASASPTQICPDDSATLTASGAQSYMWVPAAGLSSQTGAVVKASPDVTTIYTVTGTDANGCRDTATVSVTVLALPTVSAGADAVICPGDSAQLNATGAVSYVWTPATGLSCTACPDPKAAPPSDQIYTVTGTDANGCEASDEVVVSYFAQPNIVATSDVAICTGSCTIIGASGGFSYVWSPATGLSCQLCPDPTACPTSTTMYTVVGTDQNGCQGTDSVLVTVNPNPVADAGSDETICSGESVVIGGSPTASGGTAPYTYLWAIGATLDDPTIANPEATPGVTTSYTTTVTDVNGCEDMDTVAVTVNPLPNVDAGADQTICPGSCAQLQASGALSYTWDNDPTLSCTSCSNPMACPQATTKYYVTGTDALGCSKRDSVTVTLSGSITVTVNPPSPVICLGTSIQLTASGASTYAWAPATGLSCTNCPNPVASPTTTTTYTVIGTGGTCADTTSVTVVVFPTPTADAGPDRTICSGDATIIGGNPTASGGIPPYTYSWSPAGTLDDPTVANPTAMPTSFTCYTVVVTDGGGCADTDTVCVSIFSLPAISATATPDSICIGETSSLMATGGVSYVWMPGGLTGPAVTVSPNSTTTYTVTGTDFNGCEGTATVTVVVNPLPTADAGADQAFCDGEGPVIIGGAPTASGGTAPYTYAWLPSGSLDNATLPNPMADPAATTPYTVTVTDAAGCTSTDEVIVTVNALPTVTADPDTAVQQGQPVQMIATGATTYIWMPPTGLSNTTISNPIALPDETTCYTVTGTDQNGCSSSDSACVTIDSVSAIGFVDHELDWSIYPNPTEGKLFLEADIETNGTVMIEVQNMLGQVVATRSLVVSGRFAEELDLSQLASGWYSVVLRVGDIADSRQVLVE